MQVAFVKAPRTRDRPRLEEEAELPQPARGRCPVDRHRLRQPVDVDAVLNTLLRLARTAHGESRYLVSQAGERARGLIEIRRALIRKAGERDEADAQTERIR